MYPTAKNEWFYTAKKEEEMLKRKLNVEANNFLVDYGAELLSLNQKYPDIDPPGERSRAFSRLREAGVKRIQALVAEFGEEVQKDTREQPAKGVKLIKPTRLKN